MQQNALNRLYPGESTGTGGIDTSGTPVTGDFARFTDADTVEGLDVSEVKTALSLQNVTNESKTTMFDDSALTGATTAESLEINHPTGAVILRDRATQTIAMRFYSPDQGEWAIYSDITIADVVHFDGDKTTFAHPIVVPDEVYNATNWNGSLEVPTKNAVRDIIETLGSAPGAGGDAGEVQYNSGGVLSGLPNSAVSGSDLSLGGDLLVHQGDLLVGREPVGPTELTEADFDAGTLTNVTGNANNTLTLSNAANGTRKAVNFGDKRSNRIVVPHDTDFNITGDITIEAWVKLENPTKYSPIIGKGLGTKTFAFYIASGGGYGDNHYGQLIFQQDTPELAENTGGYGGVRLNRWEHVAVVRNATADTLEFYINGTLIRTVTSFDPTTPTNTRDLFIGSMEDTFMTSNYVFHGALHDVRVWNTARSQSEIASNMNTLSPSGSGLIGQWKMQEGTGTTIADTGSAAVNGTLSGNSYAWETLTENYSTSGNRESPVYDVSVAGNIDGSIIEWDEVEAVGHTLLVETRYSTNGGSSWSSYATATNGSAISGLSGAVDMSNGRLQIRQTFTSPTSLASAEISNVRVQLYTPAFEKNVGARNSSPTVPIDVGTSAIQGALHDSGGMFLDITAPEFGCVGDGVTDNTAAFQRVLAALGPERTYLTSTGWIVAPKGTYYFADNLRVGHVIKMIGAGGDHQAPGTKFLFADGKRMILEGAGVFGGYGENQGAAKGSFLADFIVESAGKTTVPTSTVDITTLAVTRTAGDVFEPDLWGGRQMVYLSGVNTYAQVESWTETTATLLPLRYRGTVSGSTISLLYGNPFPTGLTGVAVKINGTSVNLHASTASTGTVLTLSAAVAAELEGVKDIEIQSLGSQTGLSMKIFVIHGIEVHSTVNMQNVSVKGFAGNGIDLNSYNLSYDLDRNLNNCTFINVKAQDCEGHGIFVVGGNANACSFTMPDGFGCRGFGIYEQTSFGNGYSHLHTDSNRLGAVYMDSSSTINYWYTEGNQPTSVLKKYPGGGGPVLSGGGWNGAGLSYDSDALVIANTGDITGAKTLEVLNESDFGGRMVFTGDDGRKRTILMENGVNRGAVQTDGQALWLSTNTWNDNGSWQTPIDTSKASWWVTHSAISDYIRWYRAPATAGTPSWTQFMELNAAGLLSVLKLAIGGGGTINKVLFGQQALDFGSIAAGETAELPATVSGVAASDEAVVTVSTRSSSPVGGLMLMGYISGTNTVTVRAANVSGSSIDPGNSDYLIQVTYKG